jgi:plasmid stabilization system protein ParE
MARLIWSPRAARELAAICKYVEQDSEQAARELAKQLVALAESIPRQPYLGAIVEEYYQEEIRERLCHSYRLIYRLKGEDVEVATIVHGARRLPRNPPG